MVRRLPFASTSKFERIGIVVLRSTTPCVVVSSFNSADFVTLNSMDWLSSRAVPVAVISQEPFLGTQLYWPLLYSLFASLKRPRHEFALWKWLEMWRDPKPDSTQNWARKFTVSNTQQEKLLFDSKKDQGNLVVVMTCVNLWKALQVMRRQMLAGAICQVAHCENIGKVIPNAEWLTLNEFSSTPLNKLSAGFRIIVHSGIVNRLRQNASQKLELNPLGVWR